MLESTRVEENFAMSGELLISVSIAVMKNASVYLWAENDLHAYIRLFKSWDLNVCKVVCAAPKAFQKVDDVEIISPESLLNDKTPRKIFFVVPQDYSIDNAQTFWNDTMILLKPLAVHFLSPNERKAIIFRHERFDVDKMFFYPSPKTRRRKPLALAMGRKAAFPFFIFSFLLYSSSKGGEYFVLYFENPIISFARTSRTNLKNYGTI